MQAQRFEIRGWILTYKFLNPGESTGLCTSWYAGQDSAEAAAAQLTAFYAGLSSSKRIEVVEAKQTWYSFLYDLEPKMFQLLLAHFPDRFRAATYANYKAGGTTPAALNYSNEEQL